MTLGDVTLALAAEFDLPTEIGTDKRGFDNDLLFRMIYRPGTNIPVATEILSLLRTHRLAA